MVRTTQRRAGTGEALVLGGSMAGLLAARVLADRYDRVTVVDRDALDTPVGTRPRRGVPQGRHAHGLLAAGLRVIEELLPGTTGHLTTAGVPSGDMLGNVRFCANGHPLKQVHLGINALASSRPLLESYVRSRLAALPGVTMLGGYDIVSAVASADRTRVTGARVQRREPGSEPEVYEADLVIDATGRGSRAPRWLAGWGYRPPVEEKLVVDLGYTSRHYRIDPARLGGDIAIICGATLDHPRGGALMLQENGRAIVTLFGMLGDHPPTDDAGFRAFAGTLPLPYLADAIDGAHPLDDPVLYRYAGSTRYRYDRLRRFPAGLIVLGDALCSFNPIYGQGMTVAAVEAVKLRECLDRATGPLGFFRAVQPVLDSPWQIATGGDLVFPGVVGERDPMVRFVNGYLARYHAAAEHDEVLSAAFIQVTNLLAAPRSLLRPGLVRRVLRGGRPALAPALAPVPPLTPALAPAPPLAPAPARAAARAATRSRAAAGSRSAESG